MTATPAPRRWLVGAVLVGALLRCFRLGHDSLWVDEYESLKTALVPLAEIPAAAMADHALNPPLYFWMLHLSMPIFGQGEAGLRLLSVGAGVLTIPCIWLLAREVSRSEWVANLSAALIAVHPMHIWYSQEARPYALVFLVSSAALWCLAVALGGRSAWGWAGFAVFGALSILTHVLGFSTLVVGALWAVAARRDLKSLLLYSAAALAALVLVTPVLIMWAHAAAEVEGTGGQLRPFTGLEVPYTIYTYLAGYSFGPPLRELQEVGWRSALLGHPAQVAIITGTLLALGWLAIGLRSTAARDLAIVFLGPIALATAGSLVTTKAFNVRYALTGLIGFIPLIALALARLPAPARSVAAGGVLGLFLWADTQWFTLPAYRKDDSRGAAACLQHLLPDGATVLVAPAYMANVLRYYAVRDGRPLHVVAAGSAEDVTRAPGAAALLLTRLHHLPNAADLRRAFGQPVENQSLKVAGYHFYLAGPAPADLAPACRGAG